MQKCLLFTLFPLLVVTFIPWNTTSVNRVKPKWTGWVNFLEKTTGGETLFFEWKMEAVFKDDTGRVTQTYKSQTIKGDSAVCRNAHFTELEAEIDEVSHTYSIVIPVEGCSGYKVEQGIRSTFIVSDETAIMINNQPIGKNQNELVGSFTNSEGPDGNGIIHKTTYSWNLKRPSK